ncbi:4'-phosphopantetheinyl transferase [Streptomyces sp. MNP-20]|uniref:4'-phosphopantetheinyl transferase family protein n=1 Tax=Streptomyces sp. MNP-20 TaxID=2721165 RepID=UPI0015577FCE|nr:4'-phosphopantetheinyl transferase superfamily protein [Streptomyces sp. MNP-20]
MSNAIGRSRPASVAPLAEVLPPGVHFAESEVPAFPQVAPLAAEAALLVGALPARREEFLAGRACAHRALAALGIPDAARRPVLRGPAREPLWPAGVTGSITHRGGYCAAAVAWRHTHAALGIDAELARALPPGVEPKVCTPAERRWLSAQPPGQIPWNTLLFSAKESFHKAWFALTGQWLGPLDAEVVPQAHPAPAAQADSDTKSVPYTADGTFRIRPAPASVSPFDPPAPRAASPCAPSSSPPA